MRDALLASGRGLLLAIVTLAGSIVLFVASVLSLILIVVGVGVFTTPSSSRWCARTPTAAGRWPRTGRGGDRPPYRRSPVPRETRGGRSGQVESCAQLLKDPATWRDLLWLLVDMTGGFVTATLAYGFLAYGVQGWVLGAGTWRPIVDGGGTYWYGFVPVTSLATSLLAVLLGTALIALSLYGSPLSCAATSCCAGPSSRPPRTWRSPSASSTSPRPGTTPSTPPPPNCAASSGTCTTARRPGSSPWA
ncbi:sensor domain-containing protein [Streptomyces sp. M19]